MRRFTSWLKAVCGKLFRGFVQKHLRMKSRDADELILRRHPDAIANGVSNRLPQTRAGRRFRSKAVDGRMAELPGAESRFAAAGCTTRVTTAGQGADFQLMASGDACIAQIFGLSNIRCGTNCPA